MLLNQLSVFLFRLPPRIKFVLLLVWVVLVFVVLLFMLTVLLRQVNLRLFPRGALFWVGRRPLYRAFLNKRPLLLWTTLSSLIF